MQALDTLKAHSQTEERKAEQEKGGIRAAAAAADGLGRQLSPQEVPHTQAGASR
jgi:hypothetical protein